MNSPGGEETVDGTSFASPHVAGAVALVSAEGAVPWLRAARAHQELARRSLVVRHRGDYPLAQLSLDPALAPGTRALSFFAQFYRPEADAPLAPGVPQSFATVVRGAGFDVGAAYLHLDLAGAGEVTGRLVGPTGAEAPFTVVAPVSAILGRHRAPGVFEAVRGSPANGTWRVELEATGDGPGVSYAQAALHLAPADCVPACGARVCGDDGCGGHCGACAAPASCTTRGECLLSACVGDTTLDALPLAVEAATLSGDLRDCARHGTWCGGRTNDRFYRWELDRPMWVEAVARGDDVVLGVLTGGGEARACSAELVLRERLPAGPWILAVDSRFGGSAYEIDLSFCEPRCDGRACGDDGCGGTCGACDPAAACVDGACVCPAPCGDACCGAGTTCHEFACCAPVCDGRACGDDGCGGSCGACGDGLACGADGTCAAACDGSCSDAGDGETLAGGCGCGGSEPVGLALGCLVFVLIRRRRSSGAGPGQGRAVAAFGFTR